jgi:hypothetical protein
MRKTAIALAAIGLLSAFTVAAPPPAEAHGWDHRGREYGWRDRDHHNTGAAIGLGILGGILAGAAIASSQHYYYPPSATYYAPYGYAGYGYYR